MSKPQQLPELPHENILRETTTEDVYEKYEKIGSLGQGSIGDVTKVRILRKKIGGSAFHHKQKQRTGAFGLGVGLVRHFRNKHGQRKLQTFSQAHLYSEYALKSIIVHQLSPTSMKELKNEIEILRSMDHPNIVRAYEVYSSKRQIYLVLELCGGGNLYTRSPYEEPQARRHVGKFVHMLALRESASPRLGNNSTCGSHKPQLYQPNA
jgi:serine/threonine protein kinase